jgi:LysM repeat protein
MRMATGKGLSNLKGRFYIVQYGDSMHIISQRFGVSVAEMLAFNDHLTGSDTIIPGEILFIPMTLQAASKAISKKGLAKKPSSVKRRK